jgi:hypothetical protein
MSTESHSPSTVSDQYTLRWTAPHLAQKLSWGPWHWIATTAVGIVICVGSVMDAQVMQPALAHILRGSGSHVAFICYVIGVLAALMMARAGWLLRGAVGDSRLLAREGSIATLLIAAWIAMGALIAVARWKAAGLAESTTTITYDGATTANTTQQQSAHLAAVVFLGIYLITGVLALADFYTARNDIFQQKLNAHGRLTSARAALHEEEALLHRLAANLTNATASFTAIPGEAELAKANQHSLIDRLKQEAVLRYGAATESAAVLGVASTRHPLNPASTS